MIDTNVLIVANGGSPQASNECVISAVDYLEFAEVKSVVVLDSNLEIFEEYARYCSFRGQPGVGDRFFLYLHRLQADTRRVQKVDIHPDGAGSYDEVPAKLRSFDKSDQKFIATVIADDRNSTVVNCVDSDWSASFATLHSCGISVTELCADCIRKRHR